MVINSQDLVVALVVVVGISMFLLLMTFALFNDLRKEIHMFKDDVTAALVKQSTAIDNLVARVPPTVDPATIVPVADQQAAVAGIQANTDRIDAVAPAPAPAPAP